MLLNALHLFFTCCPQTLHINPSTRWLMALFCVKPLSLKSLCWSHLMPCLLVPWRSPGNPQVSWVLVTRDKWAATQTACLYNCDFFSVIKSFPNLCGNYTLLTKYRKQVTLQSVFHWCFMANSGCDSFRSSLWLRFFIAGLFTESSICIWQITLLQVGVNTNYLQDR